MTEDVDGHCSATVCSFSRDRAVDAWEGVAKAAATIETRIAIHLREAVAKATINRNPG